MRSARRTFLSIPSENYSRATWHRKMPIATRSRAPSLRRAGGWSRAWLRSRSPGILDALLRGSTPEVSALRARAWERSAALVPIGEEEVSFYLERAGQHAIYCTREITRSNGVPMVASVKSMATSRSSPRQSKPCRFSRGYKALGLTSSQSPSRSPWHCNVPNNAMRALAKSPNVVPLSSLVELTIGTGNKKFASTDSRRRSRPPRHRREQGSAIL